MFIPKLANRQTESIIIECTRVITNKQKRKMREFLRESWVLMLILIVIVIGFGYVVSTSTKVSEIDECHKWQEQAAEFSGFYLVQWQADQCKAHQIQINAPIR